MKKTLLAMTATLVLTALPSVSFAEDSPLSFNVSVTTEGGTSAPLALNVVQVNAEGSNLGDVAFDPANGTLWVSDYTSPGHLLRIDAATGPRRASGVAAQLPAPIQ